MRSDNLYAVPADLPVPEDDGACDHLRGMELPSIGLPATSGEMVDLSKAGAPWVVIYCYPRTGRPARSRSSAWRNGTPFRARASTG